MVIPFIPKPCHVPTCLHTAAESGPISSGCLQIEPLAAGGTGVSFFAQHIPQPFFPNGHHFRSVGGMCSTPPPAPPLGTGRWTSDQLCENRPITQISTESLDHDLALQILRPSDLANGHTHCSRGTTSLDGPFNPCPCGWPFEPSLSP
jgi:hypothetical protein